MRHSIMEVCSSAVRGLLIPDKGCKFLVSDLSNIEGRVLVWLANEPWKLKAFSDFDKGIGHDLYKVTYAKAFGVTPESVTKPQRQIGKVKELAFGYQGGVGAGVTFATSYAIDLDELAARALPNVPFEIKDEAINFLQWLKDKKANTHGLSDNAFLGLDCLKRLWRNAHPNVVSYWKEIDTACKTAICEPGKTLSVGFHKIRREGSWLRIKLPSGRYLQYLNPAVIDGKISYAEYRKKTWIRVNTYGGKLVENITQAVARDILVHGMFLVRKMGYVIKFTVHDEIVAQSPDEDKYNVQDIIDCMAANPPWAMGLPLAAAGDEMHRYCKADNI